MFLSISCCCANDTDTHLTIKIFLSPGRKTVAIFRYLNNWILPLCLSFPVEIESSCGALQTEQSFIRRSELRQGKDREQKCPVLFVTQVRRPERSEEQRMQGFLRHSIPASTELRSSSNKRQCALGHSNHLPIE